MSTVASVARFVHRQTLPSAEEKRPGSCQTSSSAPSHTSCASLGTGGAVANGMTSSFWDEGGGIAGARGVAGGDALAGIGAGAWGVYGAGGGAAQGGTSPFAAGAAGAAAARDGAGFGAGGAGATYGAGAGEIAGSGDGATSGGSVAAGVAAP